MSRLIKSAIAVWAMVLSQGGYAAASKPTDASRKSALVERSRQQSAQAVSCAFKDSRPHNAKAPSNVFNKIAALWDGAGAAKKGPRVRVAR